MHFELKCKFLILFHHLPQHDVAYSVQRLLLSVQRLLLSVIIHKISEFFDVIQHLLTCPPLITKLSGLNKILVY